MMKCVLQVRKCVSVMVVLYNIVCLPIQWLQYLSSDRVDTCLQYSYWSTTTWIVLNYLTDSVLLVDVCVNVVAKKRHKWRQYRTYLDLASIVPLELLISAQLQCYTSAYAWWRTNRLLRSYHVLNVLRDPMWTPTSQQQLSLLVCTILKHCFHCALVAHVTCITWLACALGRSKHTTTWLSFTHCGNDCSLSQQYLLSAYFTCSSLVTTGLGDIVAHNDEERVLLIVIMIVGVIMCAKTIALFTFLFTDHFELMAQHIQQMESLEYYMKARNLDVSVQTCVREFFAYIWTNKAVNVGAVERLPPQLRQSVMVFGAGKTLSDMYIFQQIDASMFTMLMGKLQSHVIPPQCRICSRGQLTQLLYMLMEGQCVTVASDRHVLHKGAYFGENCVLNPLEPMQYGVDSIGTCELYTLNHQDFRQCLGEQFVTFRNRMKDRVNNKSNNSNSTRKCGGGAATNPLAAAPAPATSDDDGVSHQQARRRLQRLWVLLSMCVFMYTLLATPMQLSFYRFMNESTRIGLWVIDIIIDLMFVLDIVWRSTYWQYAAEKVGRGNRYHSQRSRCISPSTTFGRYVYGLDVSISRGGGLFVFDTVSVLPVDHACHALFGAHQLYHAFRLVRLVRAVHIPEYWRTIQRVTQRLHPLRVRVVAMVCIVVIVNHLIGCVWHGVGDHSDAYALSWLAEDELLSHSDTMFNRYIRSVYFAIVVSTTTGYGDVVPRNTKETLTIIFVICVTGVLYYAAIGAVSAMLTYMTSLKLSFEENLDRVFKYLTVRNTAPALAARIKRYYFYLWTTQRGIDEQRVLDSLPMYLKRHLVQSILLKSVSRVPLFDNASEGLCRAVCNEMTFEHFAPGDYIISAGDRDPPLVFVNSGRASVLSGDMDYVVGFLDVGDYYGEGSFLVEDRNPFHVRALTYCHVAFLTQRGLNLACREYRSDMRMSILRTARVLNLKHTMNFENVTKNLNRQKVRDVLTNELHDVTDGDITRTDNRVYAATSMKVGWWNMLKLALVIWHAWSISIRICFAGIHTVHFSYLDIVLDCFLWVDMYLRATYFALDVSDGDVDTMMVTRAQIREHYMANHWRRDLLTCVPVDALMLIVWAITGTPVDTHARLRVLALCRLPRLINVTSIPVLFMRLRRLVRETGIGIPVNVVNLIQLSLLILAISHTFACAFYSIAIFENSSQSWIQRYDWHHSSGTTLGSLYLRSVYWCLSTLTVICFGDIVPVTLVETLFTVLLTLVGFFIMGAIIGNIFTLALNMNHATRHLKKKTNHFDEYAKRHGLPLSLQRRAKMFWTELLGKSTVSEEQRILASLPRSLRLQLMSETYEQFIYKQHYFCDLSHSIRRNLAERLQKSICTAGEIVYSKGESGDNVYILTRGAVELYEEIATRDTSSKPAMSEGAIVNVWEQNQDVIMETPTIPNDDDTIQWAGAKQRGQWIVNYDVRSGGDVFGDLSFLLETKRLTSVRCVRDCEYIVLSRDSFEAIFHGLPIELEGMKSKAREVYASFVEKRRELFAENGIESSELTRESPPSNTVRGLYTSVPSSKKLPLSSFSSSHRRKRPSTPRTSSRRLPVLCGPMLSSPTGQAPSPPPPPPPQVRDRKLHRLSICTSNTKIKYCESSPCDDSRSHTPLLQDHINTSAYSVRKCLWPIITFFVVVAFNWICVPLRISFLSASAGASTWDLLNWCSDVVLWFDVISVVRLLNCAPKIVYLLCALPTALVPCESYVCVVIARVPRLLYSWVWWKEYRHLLKEKNTGILTLVAVTTMCMHGFACMWLMLGEWSAAHGEWGWFDTVALPSTSCGRYLYSVYFVATALTTVGLGDVTPTRDREYILVLALISVGCMVFGSLAMMFQSRGAHFVDKVQQEKEIQEVRRHMKRHLLPQSLQKRVMNHLQFHWQRAKGLNEGAVLKGLPSMLLMDIHGCVNADFIRRVPLLRDSPPVVQRRMTTIAEPQEFRMNDIVAHGRQIRAHMFFILSGGVLQTVETWENKQVQYMLQPGDFFGEQALSRRRPPATTTTTAKNNDVENDNGSTIMAQTTTFVALSECQVFSVNCDKLAELMNDYPLEFTEFVERVQHEANTTLQLRTIDSCGEYFPPISSTDGVIFDEFCDESLSNGALWSQSPSHSLILSRAG